MAKAQELLKLSRKILAIEIHLHILDGGRQLYLSYLRNLTIISVIASLTYFSALKLEPTIFSQSTFNFVCLLAMLIFAFYANSTTFFEDYLATYSETFNKVNKRLVLKGLHGLKHTRAMFSYSWRNKPVVFIEIFIVYVVFQYGLVAVIVSAMVSTKTIINLGLLH